MIFAVVEEKGGGARYQKQAKKPKKRSLSSLSVWVTLFF
jgi:hypothetical protein